MEELPSWSGPTMPLLFIEPKHPASPTPVIDGLTRRMCAALRTAKPGDYLFSASCGIHRCVCGAVSTNCNYTLENGEVTNSLCVHYVAFHRNEVPAEQLARVAALPFGEVDPNDDELQGPAETLRRAEISTARRRRVAEIVDAIRQVLSREWDPSSVRGHEDGANKYDSYVAPVYRILAGSRSEDELVAALLRIGCELMGPSLRSPEHLRAVARRLLALDVRL